MAATNWKRFLPDPYIVALVSAVITASILPCRGIFAQGFNLLTTAAIVLLFFLHGARLSREAVIAGMGHWRLHLMVLASSFILFPLLGLGVRALGKGWIDSAVTAGVLFLCLLPSTVQSSIALTAVARGNVAAAVCSASASNLIGIFLTPVLVGLFLGVHGGTVSLQSVLSIVVQLLVPFLAGHLSRPLTAAWLNKRKAIVGLVDRGSIVLVVYTAFSAAVVEGLWSKVSGADLGVILGLDALVLAIMLAVTTWGARALGFSREDEVAIVFCGSKKSLASGVPMAGVLFPAATVGAMILPLMMFHQMQLMVCAVLARRYAAKAEAETAQSASSGAASAASDA